MVAQVRVGALRNGLHNHTSKLASEENLPHQEGGELRDTTVAAAVTVLQAWHHEVKDWRVGHCCKKKKKSLLFQSSHKCIQVVKPGFQSEA